MRYVDESSHLHIVKTSELDDEIAGRCSIKLLMEGQTVREKKKKAAVGSMRSGHADDNPTQPSGGSGWHATSRQPIGQTGAIGS